MTKNNQSGSDTSSMGMLNNLRYDLPASIVVFLVATPLCLGIALASGAPLFSGIIAGIVGGIVVGALSGSPLGVSGPAAGLAVIVLTAISSLGAYETFLMAVVLAGVLQLILGFLRAGIIGYYFPSSVIKGMLSGIGLIIFLKQIPHAFGYDEVPEGSMTFIQVDSQNTFSELLNMINYVRPGAVIITIISLAILILWEQKFIKKLKFSQLIQGPLVAVIAGILLNELFRSAFPSLLLQKTHLVQIPESSNFMEFLGLFTLPDFTQIANPAVITTAFTIAVVASLETLLCVEATDKLDPYKRVTPTNLELKAQGIGNMLSGLIGGLPVTQVIVRSSANIQSGGRSKMSAIIHGFMLLFAAMLIPGLLNMIPLATLAAILFLVGYKLAKPSLFKQMYNLGWFQFIPFIVTIVGIITTDLLIGIGMGLAVAIFFILMNNFRNPYFIIQKPAHKDDPIVLHLSEDVSFLNRAVIMKTLDEVPAYSKVIIDGARTVNIDHDVLEIFRDFKQRATLMNIELEVEGIDLTTGTPTQGDAVKEAYQMLKEKKEALAEDEFVR